MNVSLIHVTPTLRVQIPSVLLVVYVTAVIPEMVFSVQVSIVHRNSLD